ncbi:hypothetical protein [Sporolactobacillus laevolacticus]|uniref:Uncharacterized protein n=1 Tax=Sporolactobacillus laevolacticus DSM 442 TaxID=1395513 RepID=V6IVK6_9BACL|nr:hypothetical protein [Sporolactobacillus laevolacticus]EST11258.1 hypothetical protein P343_12625 [Sporolactobacillus laevolacticus DSM 442]
MINIDIEQNRQIETVRFGGEEFKIDFSDAKQKQYTAAYEKMRRKITVGQKEYTELEEKDETTGDELAQKAVQMLEIVKNGNIEFLDLLFGKGAGQRIYAKCGRSTDYLSDKVEELATALSAKRNSEHENKLNAIKHKYVKH